LKKKICSIDELAICKTSVLSGISLLKPNSNVITCQNNLLPPWLVNNGQYGAIIIDVFSQGILA